jgi:hypothetical protein
VTVGRFDARSCRIVLTDAAAACVQPPLLADGALPAAVVEDAVLGTAVPRAGVPARAGADGWAVAPAAAGLGAAGLEGAAAGVACDAGALAPPGTATERVVTAGVVTAGVVMAGVVVAGVVPTGAVAVGVVTAGVVTAGTVAVGAVTAGTVGVGIVGVGTVGVGRVGVGRVGVGSGSAAAGDTAAAATTSATRNLRLTGGKRTTAGLVAGSASRNYLAAMSSSSSDHAPSPREDLELRVETCRIRLWKGYVTGMFYAAILDDAPDEGESVCEPSASFKWRGRNDSEEARAAHRDVVSRLAAAGWTLAGAAGDPWYATSFTRTVFAPREQPAADEFCDDDETPVPEPPAPEPPTSPPPALPPAAARKGIRVDVWRVTAVTGLAAATLAAVWLAVHDGVALP